MSIFLAFQMKAKNPNLSSANTYYLMMYHFGNVFN
jgi:hypothetical protein